MTLFERTLIKRLLLSEAISPVFQVPLDIAKEADFTGYLYLKHLASADPDNQEIKKKANQTVNYMKVPHDTAMGLAAASINLRLQQSEEMRGFILDVYDPAYEDMKANIQLWAARLGWDLESEWDLLADPEDPKESGWSSF